MNKTQHCGGTIQLFTPCLDKTMSEALSGSTTVLGFIPGIHHHYNSLISCTTRMETVSYVSDVCAKM